MRENSDQHSSTIKTKFHLLIIIAGIFVFLLLQIPLSNYLIDDAYIHLTFARNISEGHGFSFNPDEPTYGVSAPLWTLFLAFLSLIFGASPAVAKIASILFGILSIPLIFRLAKRIGLTQPSAVCVAVAWSVNVWLVRWSASGMESSLAVLLLILAFDAQHRKSNSAAIWFGLSALARLELVIFLPIFALDQWIGRGIRKSIEFLNVFLLVFLPWNIYAWRTFGTIIPNPARIKSDTFLPPLSEITFNIKRIGGIFLTSSLWEIVAIAVIILVLWRTIRRGKSAHGVDERTSDHPQLRNDVSMVRTILLLGAWLILPPLFYLSRGIFIQSRYIVISMPALVLLCFFLVDLFDQKKLAFFRYPIRYFLVAVIVIQNLIMTFVMTYPHARAFRQTTDALIDLAAYLREHTPAESSVAVGDVGLIGFHSHRYVIDVEGLITHQIIPIRKQSSQSELIASETYWSVKRPDYVIDNSDIPSRLCSLPTTGHHYVEIKSIPIIRAMIGQKKEIRYYTLYQVVK